MKVLILGANGQLGPHVVRALEGRYGLRLTDVQQRMDTPHEYFQVEVSNPSQVMKAADGMDAIVNLSVLRNDGQLAFDVNARGCYNIMTTAVEHGIRRVINTGPHFAIAGPTYEDYDYGLNPDMPPQPGTNLYALTKSLGQEVCRVFTENHDVYVLCLLFYNFREPGDISAQGKDLTPFSVAWEDAGEAFKHALEVDLASLPSHCEAFNIFADLPHNKFSNEKAKRLLGWQPEHRLEQFWHKAP
jgi:nucleoside-diphosphate-sugar epimerase